MSIEISFEFSTFQSRIIPNKIDTTFYTSEFWENPETKFLLCCDIFKLIFCLYTLWLVYIKIRYRKVLPGVVASLSRDFV